MLLLAHPARAALHHAGLVIEHSGGRIVARCVEFTEEQITGLQLIQRSGVQYQSQSFGQLGSAMCQLDSEPATVPANCFGTGPYWQYFHRTGGGWAQSPLGVNSWTLHDGDIDGWHYASGAGQAPPPAGFGAVCSPAKSVATSSAATAPTPARGAGSATKTVSPATAPAIATAAATPGPQALLPAASPSPQRTIASASSTTHPRRPPGSLLPLLLFGGTIAALLGLLARNFRRHRL